MVWAYLHDHSGNVIQAMNKESLQQDLKREFDLTNADGSPDGSQRIPYGLRLNFVRTTLKSASD
jgi:hypothetical protein